MADKAKRQVSILRKKQHILYIGIFTLVAVMVWVAGSLFQSQRQTGIGRELQLMAEPLNPNINTFVIDRIEQKQSYSDEELEQFEILVIDIEAENQANINQPAEENSPLSSPSPEPTQPASPAAQTTPN